MSVDPELLDALESMVHGCRWTAPAGLPALTFDTMAWADTRPKPTLTAVTAEAARLAAVRAAVATNAATIYERAAAALDTDRAFLAVATPSNAQLAAQLKELTRQNIGIIRLVLGQLDDGTE